MDLITIAWQSIIAVFAWLASTFTTIAETAFSGLALMFSSPSYVITTVIIPIGFFLWAMFSRRNKNQGDR